MTHLKTHLFVIILFSFFIFLSGENYCQTYIEKDVAALIKENSSYNINNFILDKVNNNKIVMLADQGHGKHVYMQTVINYLNYWLDTLEKSNDYLSSKLYLVLECDSTQIDSIYKYFESGNPYYLLNPSYIIGNQFTTSVVEFFDDLRKIYQRVVKINKNHPAGSKILFGLFGPESVIDLSNWSTEKRDKYFVYERDEYSSSKIIEVLDKDTTAKALIFYGSAHMISTKTQKIESIKDPGYFMGHYLEEHYKDKGGFYRIDQVSIDNPWVNNVYKYFSKNCAFVNSLLNGYMIPNNLWLTPAEATLILVDRDIKTPSISAVWSQNTIDCFLNNSQKYSNFSSEFFRWEISSWGHYLDIISGKEPEKIDFKDSVSIVKLIESWKEWRKNLKTNFAEEIINQNIIKGWVHWFKNSEYPSAYTYERDLGSYLLNGKIWYMEGGTPLERANNYEKALQKFSQPIIFEQLIYMLWIGTDNEKHTAIEYLKKATSQNLSTAKEWTEWWRSSEYCN